MSPTSNESPLTVLRPFIWDQKCPKKEIASIRPIVDVVFHNFRIWKYFGSWRSVFLLHERGSERVKVNSISVLLVLLLD